MIRLAGILKWALGLGALGALIWGGMMLWQSATAPATAETILTQEYTVTRGDITASISPIGEVYAPHQTSLFFKAGGVPLTGVYVKVGQQVQAGDLLAEIDTSSLQGNLGKARANLLSAEQALKKAEAPYSELDRFEVEAAVAQGEANLAAARQRLDDLLNPDVDAAMEKGEDARRSLESAQNKLLTLKTDSSTREQIETLQWQANELEAEHGQLVARNAGNPHPTEAQLDEQLVARNKMLDAQEAVQRAQLGAELDLLRADQNVIIAERALADAEEALAEQRAGPDQTQIAQAQVSIQQAEYDLAKAEEHLKTVLAGPDANQLRVAQARYDAALATYEESTAELENSALIAPWEATVVTVRGSPGDTVSSNTAVITLADLNDLRVRASIDETQISMVEVGQTVVITFDALPGARFRGEVLAVPLEGRLVSNVVIYEVEISLDEARDSVLKPGMTANLQIEIGSKQNVLLVPIVAIAQNVEGTFVTVKEADAASVVPVQLGLRDGTYMEVVRGLNVGDTIVITYQAAQTQTSFFGQIQRLNTMGGQGEMPPVPAR